MKCTNCGSDFASNQLKCPYCGTVNESALKLARELQAYADAYEEKREDLLETGTEQVLRHLTIKLGIVFLAVVLFSFAFITFYQYRFGMRSSYQVRGERYEKNREQLARYMDEKQYIRAYLLASRTDPTGELFKNYPEYQEELIDIYTYTIILVNVLQSMDAMEAGDNYTSLRDTELTTIQIFYDCGDDGEVKKDLIREVDGYLKNYYRLTEEEIERLKTLEMGRQFTLEGSADIEGITKERMEAYFGKESGKQQ